MPIEESIDLLRTYENVCKFGQNVLADCRRSPVTQVGLRQGGLEQTAHISGYYLIPNRYQGL